MKYSIIVPTYNRLNYLKNCLAALFSLNIDNFDFEIVVVCDESKDGTIEFLEKTKRSNFRFIKINHQGVSYARNRGVSEAGGEIVVFTDDDCEPDKEWLIKINRAFLENKEADGVIGQTFYVSKNYRGYFPERVVKNLKALWPMTSNIAYRRQVFERIGLFNTGFTINEDTEFAYRFLKAGFVFARSQEAFVYHQRSFWTRHSLLASAKNLGTLAFLKKQHPAQFKNKEFRPEIFLGFIVSPEDYLIFLTLPISLPVLFLRYLFINKGKKIGLFFAKWPAWLILRRLYLWQAAIKNRVLLI